MKKFNPILDGRDEHSAGWKFNEWELKGIPIRIEIGPKDVEKKQVILVRRDSNKKTPVKLNKLAAEIERALEDMQKNLFQKAKKFLKENIVEVKTWNEFVKAIKNKKMVYAPFCETEACEESIKDETTTTSRCIPFNQKKVAAKCIKCGKPAKSMSYFAKSY